MHFLTNFFTSVTVFIGSLFGSYPQMISPAIVKHHEQPAVLATSTEQGLSTEGSNATNTEFVKMDNISNPSSDERKDITLSKQDLKLLKQVDTALENYKWDKKQYPKVLSDLYPAYYPSSSGSIPGYVQTLYDEKSKVKLENIIEKIAKGETVTIQGAPSAEIKNPSKSNYSVGTSGNVIFYENKDYGFSLNFKKHLIHYESMGYLYKDLVKTMLFEFNITDGGTVTSVEETRVSGYLSLFVQPKSSGCVSSDYKKESTFTSNGHSFDIFSHKESAGKNSLQTVENYAYVTEIGDSCYVFRLKIVPMENSVTPKGYIESIQSEALGVVKSLSFK